MKPRRFLSLFLIMPALCGCGNESSAKIYRIDKTLDFSLGTHSTYEAVSNNRGAEAMISALKRGESVLFYFAAYDCGHCLTFERTFVSFIKDNALNAYGFYRNSDNQAEYLQERTRILDYFSDYEDTDYLGSTPTVWLAQGQHLESVAIGNVEALTLKNAFYDRAEVSSLSFCSSYACIEVNACPFIFLYSASDEAGKSAYEELYEPLHNSEKESVILFYDELSEDEQKEALDAFGLTEYEPTLLVNEKALSYSLEALNDYLA